MQKPAALLILVSTALCTAACADGFKGDLGGMVTRSSAPVSGQSAQTQAWPYVYGDWGRFYGRVDTFGVRTLAFGQGHLELVARISTEGVEARKTAHPAMNERQTPTPVGLGTFQRTSLGGVFAYLMHDPQSGGQLAEVNWAGRFALGSATAFPQLGMQYRSASYVNHLYGLTPAQAIATGLTAYRAGHSLVPQATLHLTLPLAGPWSVQAQLRYRWLDAAIHNSPLVGERLQSSGLLAVTRTFN